jgi:hypothetical protein
MCYYCCIKEPTLSVQEEKREKWSKMDSNASEQKKPVEIERE